MWKRGVKQAIFKFISIKDFLTEDTQLPRKIWYYLIRGNFVGYDDVRYTVTVIINTILVASNHFIYIFLLEYSFNNRFTSF